MNRYLSILLSCVVASLLTVCTSAFQEKQPAAPASRPNILVIMADDWSLHAGTYGDKVVSTPAIDQLAKEGVLFEKAFCTAPSCSPSRASMLTGRFPHQLKEGANLWGTLPASYPNYTLLLEKAGYRIGLQGKGWGPGDHQAGGYEHNPAGPAFESFAKFVNELPAQKPFCFWIGSSDPHRPYSPGLKATAGLNESALKVPAWLADNAQTKGDLLDYYAEVKRFDQTIGEAVALLQEKGLLENTLIIVSSDNGMPFPRAKANVYDAGSNVPLIVRWGSGLPKGKRLTELVSLVDMAPTILHAAGVAVPKEMTGKSLLPLLTKGQSDKRFEAVFLERQRHANIRKNDLGYPVRAVRTKAYLYIQNLEPDRWPAGDPDVFTSPGPFGDIDGGPSKMYLVQNQEKPELKQLVAWSLEKRPAEELYDLSKDPNQLHNVAAVPNYASARKQLQAQLTQWRQQTEDPYLTGNGHLFDQYEYYGMKK